MYSINDIINNIYALEVVLVLESPYKDELLHNHPLAGNSGQAVTNYIKDHVANSSPISNFTLPIGCELKNTGFSKLGIINSSLLPLDRKCYSCSIKPKKHKTIESLDLIRRNPKSITRKGKLDQRLENFLKNTFSKRVQKIIQASPATVFVPCGDLAEKFLLSCNLLPTNKINKIPHPSFNGWNELVSQQLITQLNRL